MNNIVSKRIRQTPPSFIRGILKAAESEDVISFAGGLPNPISFPQEALKESMDRVVTDYGSRVFQYSTTAGLLSLREYIAEKYSINFTFDTDNSHYIPVEDEELISENNGVVEETPDHGNSESEA